ACSAASCAASGAQPARHSVPTRRSSDLEQRASERDVGRVVAARMRPGLERRGGEEQVQADEREGDERRVRVDGGGRARGEVGTRSEEHTSELQSRENLVCRLLLEKKNSR